MTPDLRRMRGLARSLLIYRTRPWRAARLARFYARLIGEGDLAFDIGAHAGNRTRAMLATGARVVAVEPQAAFHAFLTRDLPPGATVLRVAAGRQAGEAQMAVSRLHPTVSSLAPDFAARMHGTEGFRHVAWDAVETVQVTTLDALIAVHGRPRLIKIDVEGFEAEVIGGLSRPVAWIAFEYLPGALDVARECITRLAGFGGYAFNLVRGEKPDFALRDWLRAAEMQALLSSIARDGRSGDIYARWREVGDA